MSEALSAHELKERTVRGGVARLVAQAANFLVRVGSLVILARLLEPSDFGLVGMVMAFAGILSLFRDFGLSAAAVQRTSVTQDELSALFWINLAVGAALWLLLVVLSPAIAAFYREPRLVAVTIVIAAGFLFNAAGVQHSAVLQRQMRFTALATINVVALIASTAVGIAGARAGYGYWALVAMSVVLPLVNTAGSWLMAGWMPGRPRRSAEVASMLRFGGTLTLNGIVYYLANNCDKILLGRFWGADVLGIYGRAYQLISIPTDNLNAAAGEVAFAALSRLQHDGARLKSYFLKGYSLVLAMTLPITVACAVFADDVVLVLLGPKWREAAPIFRFLAPTILVFAMSNPLGWLITSLGLVKRGLMITLVFTPVTIAGYLLGLPFGPRGVALGYSGVMMLWLVPGIAWCVHGTVLSVRDILKTLSWPFVSSALAGALAAAARYSFGSGLSPIPRLVVECSILVVVHFAVMAFAAGQKAMYVELLQGVTRRPRVPSETLASA